MNKFKDQGDLRMQYLRAQVEYFKFFIYSHEARNDPNLYEYRKRIQSEVQYYILRHIHYPLIISGAVYGLIRTVRSGFMSAAIWAIGSGVFVLNSIYNTGAKYPFELAYPAHPIVIEKRNFAINTWWYYDPEIIKFELEYLNKKVFKDGFKKQFTNKGGYKYEIAVENGETYINCIDEFDKVFEFSQDVLKDNKLMDVLSPEDFQSHKHIGKLLFW
jgi:hypothetical protein